MRASASAAALRMRACSRVASRATPISISPARPRCSKRFEHRGLAGEIEIGVAREATLEHARMRSAAAEAEARITVPENLLRRLVEVCGQARVAERRQ